MRTVIPETRFSFGQIVATPSALAAIPNSEIMQALARHQSGDWGDVCPEDRAANDQALADDSRLFSVYHAANGIKFWIITEWDRSATTVLLPGDY